MPCGRLWMSAKKKVNDGRMKRGMSCLELLKLPHPSSSLLLLQTVYLIDILWHRTCFGNDWKPQREIVLNAELDQNFKKLKLDGFKSTSKLKPNPQFLLFKNQLKPPQCLRLFLRFPHPTFCQYLFQFSLSSRPTYRSSLTALKIFIFVTIKNSRNKNSSIQMKLLQALGA